MFCRACGKNIPDDAGAICPECGQHPGTPELNAESHGLAPHQDLRDGPAFEHWQRDGFLSTLVATCKGMLLEPAETGRQMKTKDVKNAMLFAAVMGAGGAFFAALWGLLFNASIMALVSYFTGNSQAIQGIAFSGGVSVVFIPLQMIGGAMSSVTGMFIGGGITHLMLMLLKADKNGFEATARLTGYIAAGNIFQVIPFIGWIIALVWMLVVLIISLREIHETTTIKAIGAVLLPSVICCACLGGIFLTFLAAIMANAN